MSTINSYTPGMFSPDPSFYSGRGTRRGNGAGAGGNGAGGNGTAEDELETAPPGAVPVSSATLSPRSPRVRNATIGVGSAAVNEAAPISPYPQNGPYPQTASPRALLAGNDLMREGNFAAAMHNPDGTMKPGATPTGTTTTLPNGTVVPQYAETPAVQSARSAAYGPYVQNKANILGGNYFQGQQFAGDANNRLNNESTARVDQGESLAAVNNAGAEQTTLNGPYLRAGSAARTSNVNAQTGQIAPNATAERGLIGAQANEANAAADERRLTGPELIDQHRQVTAERDKLRLQVENLTKALAKKGKFDDLLDEDGPPAAGASAAGASAAGGSAPAAPAPAAGGNAGGGNLPAGATPNRDGTITFQGQKYARAQGGWKKV